MAKLCPKGKAAAKRKFKVYPSAYANMYASKVCKGKVRSSAKDGGKVKPTPGPKAGKPKTPRDQQRQKRMGDRSKPKGGIIKVIEVGKYTPRIEKITVDKKNGGKIRKQMREGGMVIEDMTKMIEV